MDAIEDFDQAIEERAKWWPEKIRDYHWTEDARDLYFLAMTYFKLSGESGDSGVHLQKAKGYFKEAEALYTQGDIPMETADIIKRFRKKATDLILRTNDS